MSSASVSKTGPQKKATREKLIEAAERMFGTHGIDSVSLRQIGSAVGSSNASVVGYHIGSKSDLIKAIFKYREPWLNQRRRHYYDEFARQHQPLALYQLLYAQWYPLFEQVDDDGMHSFSGFLAELVRTGQGSLRRTLSIDYPETMKISSEIIGRFPGKKKMLIDQRMGVVVSIICSQLRMIDLQKKSLGISQKKAEALFNDALRMVEGAITAPME